MNWTKIFRIGIAMGPLLAWQNAVASTHSRSHTQSVHGIAAVSQIKGTGSGRRPAAQRARAGRSRDAANRESPNDYRSGYVAGLRDGRQSTVQAQRNLRAGHAAEKTEIRERAERDARAERIYQGSQVSAPIITDATACKRIGTHGESIYENCQLAHR